MAQSTETGGFNFAVNAPNLAQYSALTELKPLSFAGGMQSPLEFRTMAAIRPPDAQPELVAQGIGKALGSVAEGISAVFKSKADERKDLLKFQRDKEIARVKAQAESDYRQQTLEESKRYHDILAKNASDRIDKVTPTQAKSLSTRSLGGMQAPTEAKSQSEPLDFSYPSINTGRDLTKPLSDQELDNEVEQMGGADDSQKLDLGKPPLADLTSPQGLEAAPDLRGEEALSALSSIPWNQVAGQYKSAGPIPAGSYSPQAPSWLRSPKSVMAPLAQLGGFGDQALPNTEKALADIASYTKEETAGTNKAMEDAVGVDAIYTEQDAMALRDYARKTGRMEPEIKATNAGYEVNWPTPMVLESAANRKDAAKAREETAKTQQGLREQNTLNREAVMFQSHPAVKAFTAPNGMQQSFTRFVKDYDAIVKNPEGAGISDVGLLDMFARAEGGGRVTEGQANLVLGSMGILDKAKQLGMRLEGGDRLSQNQRDQMLRVIAEDHDAQAKIANQAVQMTRAKLIKQGVKDEDSLPQPYILPKTKFQALEDINELKTQALKLNAERQKAFAAGNKTESEMLKKQIEEIGKNAIELRRKIDKSKSSIINLEEIETTPQGWTGGAATTLIQQQ
jgi:hypothetical protein